MPLCLVVVVYIKIAVKQWAERLLVNKDVYRLVDKRVNRIHCCWQSSSQDCSGEICSDMFQVSTLVPLLLVNLDNDLGVCLLSGG